MKTISQKTKLITFERRRMVRRARFIPTQGNPEPLELANSYENTSLWHFDDGLFNVITSFWPQSLGPQPSAFNLAGQPPHMHE